MSIQIRPSVQMDPPQGPETIAAEHSPQSSTDPARQPAEDGHQTHPVPPSTPPSAAHSQPVSTPQDEKTLPPMAPPSTRRPSTASLSNLGNRRTLSFRGIRRTSNASSMKPLALLDHVTYERSMKAMSSWTLLMKSWANDCSVGLYRIVEHVDRRVPRMAADKVRIRQASGLNSETTFADLEDIKQVLKTMSSISMQNSVDRLRQCVEIRQEMKKKEAPSSRRQKLLRSVSQLYTRTSSSNSFTSSNDNENKKH